MEQLRAEREELEREHEAARAKARAQWTRHARSDKPDAVAHPAAGGQLEVEASRAAALELKVRLDAAREHARRERERADRLLEVAANLLDLLRESSVSTDGLDEVAEGYSAALTQLLAPGTFPDE